jgi:serine/threonine protein kinase/tetratricopeptide (TPR) repeat protein
MSGRLTRGKESDGLGRDSRLSSHALRIDMRCDRFESHWRGGQRPAIEDYLAEAPEPARPALLRELLALDLELRRECGERPSPGDYGDRFPEHGDLIDDVFKAVEATNSHPGLRRSFPVLTPSQIGPYKILQPIGEGGMGVVYVAEQEKPIRRRVALKVIKDGMDSVQVVARFEVERQALALMDHPHIAKVLDAGTTGSGRPYFAMELVKGVPITDYCDENRLTIVERLRLFIPVCQAIQHAHQKGIIHRDIKPSNVLVTLAEGKPVPKVIDFGVAKAVNQRLTDRTVFTLLGTVMGTLEYMSPEQANLDGMDVDTRSDVFALGVMLYELLTGSTPLQRERLRQAGYAEIFRRIKEEQPQKPSTRLSTSGERLTAIGLTRRVEPGRLAREIRGDLDCIVMKSLEKDRTRRYETANGFARDVARYLNGEPVEACPPSAWYLLQKFTRRHRSAISLGALAAAALVAVATTSTWLALRASSAERLASRRLADIEQANERLTALNKREQEARELAQQRFTLIEQANERLTALNKREQEARELAQQRFTLAVQAVRAYGADLMADRVLHEIQYRSLRVKLLGRALTYYRQLQSGLEGDPDLQTRVHLADAYYDTAAICHALGHKKDALEALIAASSVREELIRRQPNNPRLRVDLAKLYGEISRNVAVLGDHAGAAARTDSGCAILEELVRDYPGEPEYRRYLAGSYYNSGIHRGNLRQYPESLERFERAYRMLDELYREQRTPSSCLSLANLCNTYAYYLGRVRQYDAAIRLLERAMSLQDALPAERLNDPALLHSLSFSHYYIGDIYSYKSQFSRAVDAYGRACDIRERLVRTDPTDLRYRADLAHARRALGDALRETRDHGRAIEAFRRSRDLYDHHLRDDPEVRSTHAFHVDSALKVILTQQESSPTDSFLDDLARAEHALVSLPSPRPADLYNLARVYAMMSAQEGSRVPPDKALAALQRAIAAGYKDVNHLSADPDLKSIRNHPRFQTLMMDAGFPDDPFSR